MIRPALAALLLAALSFSVAAADLAPAPDQVRPILLGSKMPDVPLRTAAGKPTTLAAQVAGKPAILVFYRGGWCPFCNLQLSDLRLIQKEVEGLGYRMIAISPDRPEELTKTLGKDKLSYTLLSDSKAAALRAFGIGYRLDAATYAKYQGYGIDLEKTSGEKDHALPVPSVFIVDRDGVLQFSYSHPDYKVRVPGTVVLAAAKAIAERRDHLSPK
jgi:peroxiredoxin